MQTPLKPNDIVTWHISSTSGERKKVVMVLAVDDGTVWVTDGIARLIWTPQTTVGEVELLSGSEAEVHRDRLTKLLKTQK